MSITNPSPGWRAPIRAFGLATTLTAIGILLAAGISAPAAAGPPTPLQFYVSNVSATSVAMQWSPGHITGPTRFRIYQNDELVSTRYNSSYTATDLQPGGTYAYRVVAVDAQDVTSAPTRTITVTTRGPGVAPGGPSNLRSVEVDPARVTLKFDRPGDEFDVNAYRVYDGATLVATVGRTPYAHSTGTVTVRNLDPGSSHTFTVRAERLEGLSAPSEPLAITTPTTADTVAPTTPTGLSGGLAPYTCDLANLIWNQSTDNQDAPEDLDYEVFVAGNPAGAVRGTGAAYSILLPGTGQHTVTVRAVDSSGNASAHSAATVVTVEPDCQP